jgi:hypothetical protein
MAHRARSPIWTIRCNTLNSVYRSARFLLTRAAKWCSKAICCCQTLQIAKCLCFSHRYFFYWKAFRGTMSVPFLGDLRSTNICLSFGFP